MSKLKTLAIALSAAALIVSCGTAKQTAVSNSSPYGQKLEEEQCIKVYKQKPAIRAYGSGSHFKESTAQAFAEAEARAMMSRKLESAVLSATELVGVSMEQYAAGREDSEWVTDQSAEGNNLVQVISQQIVKNTSIIESSRYYADNRQFTVFVCIEYGGKESELVDAAEKALKERIKAEDRAKIEARHNDFRERILKKLGM